MSKEAALAFIRKAAEDPDLQAKLVAMAADEGYEFSVEELTDTDLDEAVGGVWEPGKIDLHKYDSP